MYDHINEAVEVSVDFRWPQVRPTLMRWNNRKYPIERVNFVHTAKEGDTRLFYFTVSDTGTANVFKLRFNTESLEWRLLEIYSDG